MRFRYVPLILAAGLVAGCQPGPSANTYQRNQTMQAATVQKGKIVSFRTVRYSGTQSGVGAGAGAVAGGVGGSFLGGGTRSNILGAVGGAVLGGVAGSAAEEAITSGEAIEFIVQLDDGRSLAIVQKNEDNLSVGERVMVLQGGQTRIVRDTAP